MHARSLVTAACLLLWPAAEAAAERGDAGWVVVARARSVPSDGAFPVASGRLPPLALLDNPAVEPAADFRVTLFSESGFVADRLNGVLAAAPFRGGTLGAGFLYYDAGTAELAWYENETLVTETVLLQRETLAFLSFSGRLTPAALAGITVKGAAGGVARSPLLTAAMVDAGVAAALSSRLDASFAARNIGFASPGAPLPAQLAAGLSGRFSSGEPEFTAGAALVYEPVDDLLIPSLSSAFTARMLTVSAGLAFIGREPSWHLGLELAARSFLFSYAFSPSPMLGVVHRFGVSFRSI